MSMIGVLVRVSQDQLNSFIEDSSRFEEFIDSEEVYHGPQYLDIDKSWEAVIYLLTGHTIHTIDQIGPPFDLFFFTGQILDEDQDLGYGPAQYLKPNQVKTVSNVLSGVSAAAFAKRFNARQLNEKKVYHAAWEEDDKEYLVSYFKEIQDFYANAARENQALITYIA